MSTSLLELDPLVIPLIRGSKILDVGCGYGHWGQLLATHYRLSGDPPRRADVIGIERHPGNATFCRSTGLYKDVIVGDALMALQSMESNSYDTVLAVDIVEHFEREQGALLLDEIERVASSMVIVSTPNFPNYRKGDTGITGYNEWEHHLSEWTIHDFKGRGYRVRGVKHRLHDKLYRLRGMYRLLHKVPLIDELLDTVAGRWPRIAHTLLAWKEM